MREIRRRELRRTIAFFLILLCPGLVYADNSISKIGVTGNRLVDKDVILMAAKAKAGDELAEDLVQDNMKLIYELGYFSNVGAEIEEFENGKYLIFKVRENSVVKDIEITGNRVLSLSEIKAVIKTKPGSIFNIPVFNDDVRKINDLYKDRGLALSQVADVKIESEGGTVKIVIVEGTIEEIRVEGNDTTQEWVVLREFVIKPGEVYNADKVRRSLQQIFNLGFFETVKPSHLKGKDPDNVILVVSVKEQRTGTASFGGGYSSSNGFVGFIQVSKKNFQGRGQTVNVKTEFGGVTNYEIGFFEPWFRHKPISLGVNFYNTKVNRELYDINGNYVNEYDERRTGGDITLGKKLAYFTTGAITFRQEKIDITPDTIAGLSLEDDEMQSLSYNLTRDSRDNVFQPTFGAYDNMMVTKTGGFLKGRNSFTRYRGTLRRYYEFMPKNVFACRLIYGLIDLSSGDVPDYEEFGLGGSGTLRGYKNREYTGRELLVANFEVRHIFSDKMTGILFFDTGDVNKTVENRFNLDKQGVGIGISVRSPIGPIRLDYGKGNNGRGGRTYFTMSETF
ncbi:MAG: BamA/TamA family outer membrane protein [Candidatus Wallbacteria bacterium]|nr:BamA/TamA family outer membrane protein [Candidatus Wallbacteria bacterium]